MRPAIALGLAMFLPAFGTHGLTTGRGDLARSLSIPADGWQMALLMAVFAFASMVSYAVMGAWGDRRGLRRALLLGIGGYLVAHVLIMVSAPIAERVALPRWIPFLGLRLLAGLAGGAITVSANALGAALYPPEARGRSLSFVWLGVPLALVIGVPLPNYLGGPWSRLPPEARAWLGDPYAAVATVSALLFLAFAVAAIPSPAATPSAAGAISGGARAPASDRGGTPAADTPLPPLRSTWWVYAVSFLLPFGVFPLIVSAERYTERAFGFTPIERGNLFVLLGVASVAGGLFSGAIADVLGRRTTLLSAAGIFALLTPLLPSCGAAMYVVLAAALGFVSTVRQGPFQALASYLADQRGRGRLSARVLIASQLGISLGQAVGIALVRADERGGASLEAIAVCSTTATALAWLLAWQLQEPARRAAPQTTVAR